MKKLTYLLLVASLIVSQTSFAGTVQTKDQKKKNGGYYNNEYHLKKKGEKENFVDKDQGWQNPFKGFGKKAGKPKKQGSMPHG